MTNKYKINDALIFINTGHLDNITVRKVRVIDIVTISSEANQETHTSYVVESTYCGSYVGIESGINDFIERLNESKFKANEEQLFKAEDVLQEVERIMKKIFG